MCIKSSTIRGFFHQIHLGRQSSVFQTFFPPTFFKHFFRQTGNCIKNTTSTSRTIKMQGFLVVIVAVLACGLPPTTWAQNETSCGGSYTIESGSEFVFESVSVIPRQVQGMCTNNFTVSKLHALSYLCPQ